MVSASGASLTMKAPDGRRSNRFEGFAARRTSSQQSLIQSASMSPRVWLSQPPRMASEASESVEVIINNFCLAD